jgi:hypothetical protein
VDGISGALVDGIAGAFVEGSMDGVEDSSFWQPVVNPM